MYNIPTQHPRLFGTREELQQLARQRPEHFQRMKRTAYENLGEHFSQALSMALVYAVEGDKSLGKKALEFCRPFIEGPIQVGHVLWGHDVGAVVYDLCHDLWDQPYKKAYWEYANKTVDANRGEETHVFHNSYFAVRIPCNGLMSLATYHENPRAPEIFADTDRDIRQRAIPALREACNGGGWAEGYYVSYCLTEFLTFCESARKAAGIDYYALAPEFFKQRAIASMFEMYPGIRAKGLREMIPLQDYGTRSYKPPRDRVNPARRILVNYHRNDPAHQVVNTFNNATPKVAEEYYAYLDFLFNDATVPSAKLDDFKLSHHSPGPGYVYARSSWKDDATYFFFKAGPHFTSHQHLDNGHFLIFKHEELAGDGGHFADWNGIHDPNYYIRTIAHNSILIHDPNEKFLGIRHEDPNFERGNDGGQAFPWRQIHINGGIADMDHWNQHKDLLQTAKINTFEDTGDYLYVAADCTNSYSRHKLEHFTREIVFLRPNTFVIFDRVKSTNPSSKKTWLLQALKIPEQKNGNLVITNGSGRLFVQTLLPIKTTLQLNHGENLYRYNNTTYPPCQNTGPAPECRVEISPTEPAQEDFFLHVLTAADAATDSVPQATLQANGDQLTVHLGAATVRFNKSQSAAEVEIKP
jgi:hypothetical protein